MNIGVIIWLVIAVVLGVVESLTVSLITIWLAIGAVGAAITAAFGGSLFVQLAVFIVISGILLFLTRPLARKFAVQKKAATNADRLLGEEGQVIIAIDPVENKGQVKIKGQIWSATAENGKEINVDEKVVVVRIEGVRAIVKRIEQR